MLPRCPQSTDDREHQTGQSDTERRPETPRHVENAASQTSVYSWRAGHDGGVVGRRVGAEPGADDRELDQENGLGMPGECQADEPSGGYEQPANGHGAGSETIGDPAG